MDDKRYTEEMVKNLNTKLKNKQAALKFDREPTEGSNNPVTSDGIKKYVDSHTIYQAGENIQIKDNVISATDTKYTAGSGININKGVITNTAQGETYTAGVNVQINNGVISATDTTYTAGNYISISKYNNKINLN